MKRKQSMSVSLLHALFLFKRPTAKQDGCVAAEKSGGCILRYGVSGFSLPSKWCSLGIACFSNQPWLIRLVITHKFKSTIRHPRTEKPSCQGTSARGSSYSVVDYNISNNPLSSSSKSSYSHRLLITITLSLKEVHKVFSRFPHH